ncbi:receptor kinase-like protein Xa21 [Tasmannia lanceolata]|uniref:receptor kinase-like protein Xa21 n=1 Tax=Tasmannia lanceolata TaxID=3420 RepID=UPI004063DCB3
MNAGDFGLARFLFEATENQSISTGLKGSIGYVAPEYGMGGKASTFGDVYSFGILLLEMFTGKRPTDKLFTDGLSLYQFTKMAFCARLMDIVDPEILSEEVEAINNNNNENYINPRNRMHDCLLSMFRIGVSCCAESPRERMVMGDVVMEIHSIGDLYLVIRVYKDRESKVLASQEDSSYLSD